MKSGAAQISMGLPLEVTTEIKRKKYWQNLFLISQCSCHPVRTQLASGILAVQESWRQICLVEQTQRWISAITRSSWGLQRGVTVALGKMPSTFLLQPYQLHTKRKAHFTEEWVRKPMPCKNTFYKDNAFFFIMFFAGKGKAHHATKEADQWCTKFLKQAVKTLFDKRHLLSDKGKGEGSILYCLSSKAVTDGLTKQPRNATDQHLYF